MLLRLDLLDHIPLSHCNFKQHTPNNVLMQALLWSEPLLFRPSSLHLFSSHYCREVSRVRSLKPICALIALQCKNNVLLTKSALGDLRHLKQGLIASSCQDRRKVHLKTAQRAFRNGQQKFKVYEECNHETEIYKSNGTVL